MSLVVVVSVLAAFSVLPVWSGPAAVAVLVADFAWLRHAAVAGHAARRAGALAGGAATASGGSASRSATPYSEDVVAGLSESPAESDPSGWAPVPVPPPTYTLKAKAEQPVRFAAPVTEPATVLPPGLGGLVGEDELDGLLDRRQA